MQVFVYLLLLLGVVALVGSGVLLVATYRYRDRGTRGDSALMIVMALVLAVSGTLWVIAFAAPSVRRGAAIAAALLWPARLVGLRITARVVQWRDARHA